MYELMFGITPFWSGNRFDMQHRIMKGSLRFPNSSQYGINYSKGFTQIVRALLERDVTKRLGAKDDAKEILAHPYFADVDVEAYLNKTVKPPFVPAFGEKDLSEFFNVKKDKKDMQLTAIPISN